MNDYGNGFAVGCNVVAAIWMLLNFISYAYSGRTLLVIATALMMCGNILIACLIHNGRNK